MFEFLKYLGIYVVVSFGAGFIFVGAIILFHELFPLKPKKEDRSLDMVEAKELLKETFPEGYACYVTDLPDGRAMGMKLHGVGWIQGKGDTWEDAFEDLVSESIERTYDHEQ